MNSNLFIRKIQNFKISNENVEQIYKFETIETGKKKWKIA